jgi:hypothetical protein
MLYISMQAFTKEGDMGDWIAVADGTSYIKVDAVDSNGSTVVVGTVQTAIFPDILGIYSYMLPVAATEVAGFKISLPDSPIAGVPSSDTSSSSDGIEFDFNFGSGILGWVAKEWPTSGSFFTATVPPSSRAFWSANGLEVQGPCSPTDGTLGWGWTPRNTLSANTGNRFYGDVFNEGGSCHLYIYYADGTNDHSHYTGGGGSFETGLTANAYVEVTAPNNGKNVAAFFFHNQKFFDQYSWINNVRIIGFTAPVVNKMLQIYTVEVRNVCAAGIL